MAIQSIIMVKAMNNIDLKSALRIRGIELLINLGWEDEEREQQQVILLDIDVQFESLPKACTSDNLADTFCYAELITLLRNRFNTRPFRLIEHLSAEIYALLKTQIKNARITLHVTKHPNVEGLTAGVCFSYGEPK